jgi:hypothetical protein
MPPKTLFPYRRGLLPPVRVFIDHLAAEFPKAVPMEIVQMLCRRLLRQPHQGSALNDSRFKVMGGRQ